ncbi:outer membrane beta-barrel family protein [Dyadobacter sp. CY347]|uniref:outer membrane beta-barrel family protein n=1 Tax=Dyadobacter sp. CY347 TaxID=2909336 RepID=UPI001F3988AD|nr:outer membrane beta-barrel family protein [Dyadobacter sp. CY347]MCF2487972.1 TonB-dependent receptor family protein [Dyadobacter sp. CY347]
MKKILLLFYLCLHLAVVHAQTGGRFTLKGVVADTSGAVLPEATIMLLLPKDSSLVNFGRTNKEGAFELKNLKRTQYIFKVSYVGFVPYQETVNPKDGDVTDLGKMRMKVLQKELYEVVIKTARAPLSIRGDTVEFDARAFKVPPGSTVEDLLRKLPGMQVDADGNIKAQGEEVKRVTVDGKRFFGDDPKMATKNLPAEAINKVQVFNGKTEQSKVTGVDDGKREKTVNLELKDSHKKGGFGKAIAGVGTDKRLEGKVSYNRFNDKQQFALLGFGNNTNQSGIARNDYQDFKGSQSFNWGDDGDFGFNSGRYYGGDDITIQPNWGGGGSEGFTKNFAGGANYNYDDKKTKLSTSYFYNQTKAIMDVRSRTENFLTNDSYSSLANSKTIGFTGNHRPSFRFEKNIDSLNTIILISNSRINSGDDSFNSYQQSFLNEGVVTNQSSVKNLSEYNSFAMANLLIYRHKFKKKGRNFAASIGYNINNADENKNLSSNNVFFQDSTRNSIINQLNETESTRGNLKGSLSYIEPFAKKFFWETFYNYSMRKDKVDRDVFDVSDAGQQVNPLLTRFYSNDFTYNRVGSSIRYSNKGLNIAAGLAGVQFELRGKFAADKASADFMRVSKSYFTFVPNVSVNYDLKNNRYVYAEYGLNVREPSITDLQPIIDNSNPLFITEGNPDLIPSSSHSVYAGYNMFNPANFINIYIGLSYNYNVNQIVYNRTVNVENLITTTKPINVTGGYSYGTYGGFGFPLKKTKATMNVNASVNLSNNITYINNVENETSTDSYNFGTRLDLTPSDAFTFYGNANWGISEAKYSINTNQNQKIFNATYGADVNAKGPMDIYFNAKFNYRIYKNDQFGFDQKLPILNLSVYKIVLKSKKGEIRLTANDVFKKNLGITQNVNQNYYTERRVATLSRYFMLSFTYNMRGVTASVKRNNQF